MWTPENITENGIILSKGDWPSWRHSIFSSKSQRFRREIILESQKILPSGPSGCSLPNSRQRRTAARICTDYREFTMRTKSKDTREAYVVQRKELIWNLTVY